MAGHSQFKNIMYRKGAQDKKRASQFTKAAREIMAATKLGGPDPASNARLRLAILAAREINMPKDNVERAIKKASGADDLSDYVEMRYEGYGPGGVAIIVDALTDNRNRTASDVRSAFTKYGGSLGETGSVSFQFDRVGMIFYPLAAAGHDAIFESALEAGAQDVAESDTHHEITTAYEDLGAVREQLAGKFGEPERAVVMWRPQVTVQVTEDNAPSLLKLIDILEDNDDVQRVSANFEMDEALLEKYSS